MTDVWFAKKKTADERGGRRVGSEMGIRERFNTLKGSESHGTRTGSVEWITPAQ